MKADIDPLHSLMTRNRVLLWYLQDNHGVRAVEEVAEVQTDPENFDLSHVRLMDGRVIDITQDEFMEWAYDDPRVSWKRPDASA